MVSNNLQIEEALRMIRKFSGQRIGFLGVAFKCDTDDLRESPTLELMAALLAEGTEFSAFDPNLKASSGARSHFDYMKHARPHLAALMDQLPNVLKPSIGQVLDECDVLVVSHSRDEYRDAVRKRPKVFMSSTWCGCSSSSPRYRLSRHFLVTVVYCLERLIGLQGRRSISAFAFSGWRFKFNNQDNAGASRPWINNWNSARVFHP